MIIGRKIKWAWHIFEIFLGRDTGIEFREIWAALGRELISQGIGIISIQYVPNTFWQRVIPPIAITKKIPLYLTVKSPLHQISNPEKWITISGDIQ